MKRISLLISDEHHLNMTQKGINISGLIRDLLDDHFSDYKITLGVTEETRTLYDRIIANTGANDQDLESYFREALKKLLSDRIGAMKDLHDSIDK